MKNVTEYITEQMIVEKSKSDLSPKELATVKSLVRLGDSEELAIKTVIENRPAEAKKQAQLKDKNFNEK